MRLIEVCSFYTYSGVALAHMMGYPLSEGWVLWALILYAFAGICWLPVVWMQIKMRDMAKLALDTGTDLPKGYWKMDGWWIVMDSLAFPAIMIVFYLMVYKPEM